MSGANIAKRHLVPPQHTLWPIRRASDPNGSVLEHTMDHPLIAGKGKDASCSSMPVNDPSNVLIPRRTFGEVEQRARAPV